MILEGLQNFFFWGGGLNTPNPPLGTPLVYWKAQRIRVCVLHCNLRPFLCLQKLKTVDSWNRTPRASKWMENCVDAWNLQLQMDWCIYKAFHNVLQDYKNLLQENRRTRIYETCTDRRNNSKIFFPSKLFFIVVHISAARRCECM
jgi:hypothetical protein